MKLTSKLRYWVRSLSGAALRDAYMQVMDEADAERDLKNFAIAARLYHAAALLRPHAFHVWVQCGNCSKDSHQFERAGVAYGKALELNPENADLHLQIGHLRKLEGHLDAARHAYARSLEIDGNRFARQELQVLASSPQPVPALSARNLSSEDRPEHPIPNARPLRVEIDDIASRYRPAAHVRRQVRQMSLTLRSAPDAPQVSSNRGQVHWLLERMAEPAAGAAGGDKLAPLVRARSRQFISAVGHSPFH